MPCSGLFYSLAFQPASALLHSALLRFASMKFLCLPWYYLPVHSNVIIVNSVQAPLKFGLVSARCCFTLNCSIEPGCMNASHASYARLFSIPLTSCSSLVYFTPLKISAEHYTVEFSASLYHRTGTPESSLRCKGNPNSDYYYYLLILALLLEV